MKESMMNDMKKMLGKAPKSQDEDKKMAKIKALKELRDNMSGMAQDGLGKALSMKKVTVAAPDNKSLKEGLDVAKEVVGDKGYEASPDKDQHDGHDGSYKSEHMLEEHMDEGMVEPEDGSYTSADECETPEQIDALMTKLQEKKKALQSKN
jgi:hypothetical protein